MTYTKAKLIVWNYDCYDRATVREAALFILGRLDSAAEDVTQACSLL